MSILDDVGGALAFGRREEMRLVAQIPPELRSARGTPKAWSTRDNLIHLAVWKLNFVQAMEAPAFPPEEPGPEQTDAVNRTIYDSARNLSWEHAEAFLAHTHRRTLQALQRFTAAQLEDANLFPWLRGRPLWRDLLGSAVMHPVFHYALIYQQIGKPQEALRMQERMLLFLDAVSPNQAWLGTGRYNLACAYALRGDRQRALEWLAEGLRLQPDLTEYSKTDPDLASLWDDPRYLALLGR